MTTEDEDWKTTSAMLRFGGSFVQALALAARAADPTNLSRIKATWPEYWTKYSDELWSENPRTSEHSPKEEPS